MRPPDEPTPEFSPPHFGSADPQLRLNNIILGVAASCLGIMATAGGVGLIKLIDLAQQVSELRGEVAGIKQMIEYDFQHPPRR